MLLLGYICYLKDAGVLIVDNIAEYDRFEVVEHLLNGTLATYRTQLSDMGSPSDKFALNFSQSNKISVELKNKSMIFLSAGTENPAEQLNQYISTFYSSNKANVLGTYGESGQRAIYSEYENIEIIMLDPDKITAAVLSGNAPYTANLSGRGYYNNYFTYFDQMTDAEIEKRRDTYEEYLEYRSNGFKEGLFEILSPLNEITDSDRKTNESVIGVFSHTFIDVLNGIISINDFQDVYDDRMKKAGATDFLDKLNNGD